jgi:hypothetical protein
VHIVFGVMLSLSSLFLLGSAYMIDHRMLKDRLRGGACNALLLLFVSIAVYFAWVASLFFHDVLGPPNYVLALWIIRGCVLLSSGYLFCSLCRNQRFGR